MFLIYWMDNLTSVSLEPCKEKKFNNLLLSLEMKTHTRIARPEICEGGHRRFTLSINFFLIRRKLSTFNDSSGLIIRSGRISGIIYSSYPQFLFKVVRCEV